MKQRLHSVKFSEHFSQAQLFYNSMSEIEKSHITAALSFELDHCDEPIVYERMISRLTDISLELAQAVATKVGGPMPEKAGRPNHGRTSKGLSQMDLTPDALGFPATIASRQIALIIGEGFNLKEYEAVKGALTAQGAFPFTIGPKRQPVIPKEGGKGVMPDHHFEGMRSTMFDALYIPSGSHIASLKKQGRVIHWIREAFGHCKTIGATGEAVELVKLACDVEGMKFAKQEDEGTVDCYGVVTAIIAGGTAEFERVVEAPRIVKGGKKALDVFIWNVSQHRCWLRELEGLTMMVAY